MIIIPISQCGRELEFRPRRLWPKAFPAFAWNNQLVSGFDRTQGMVLEMDSKDCDHFLDLWRAAYPELGLAELARASAALAKTWPDLWLEWREAFFSSYSLRLNDRLEQTLSKVRLTPDAFQDWVDDKKISVRDLTPLLAVPELTTLRPLFEALPTMIISKSEGVRALELVIELFLMGRPLNDLLPTSNNGSLFLRRLEKWRRPDASTQDEVWREAVHRWPWPAHVQAEWLRFGDESGLEVKIRTTSPEDFQKKLERLMTIPGAWSCKS